MPLGTRHQHADPGSLCDDPIDLIGDESGGEGPSSSGHGSSRRRRRGQRTTSTDMGSDDCLLERARWNDNGATRLVVGVVHGRA
jgi:hypothetical protein